VESSQHLPVSYYRHGAVQRISEFAFQRRPGGARCCAGIGRRAHRRPPSLRQTILGLDFRGPESDGRGKIHGFINMDFFGGSGEPYDSLNAHRTAGLESIGKYQRDGRQDKPLIAPARANSLAQVGLSP